MAIGPKGVAHQAPELREYEIDITPFDCLRDNMGKGFLHPKSQGPCAPPTAPLRFPLHSQQPGSSDSLLLMAADPTPLLPTIGGFSAGFTGNRCICSSLPNQTSVVGPLARSCSGLLALPRFMRPLVSPCSAPISTCRC